MLEFILNWWNWILICVIETGIVIYNFNKYYTGTDYWTDDPDGNQILDDNPSIYKRLYTKGIITWLILKGSVRSILNVPGNAMKALGGLLIIISKFITFQLKSKQDWVEVCNEELLHIQTKVNVFQKF